MISKINILTIVFLSVVSILSAQNINTYFETQQTSSFQKLYLHIDREFYFLGDTLWFAGYLLDGQTQIPAPESCNLYVDLINSDGIIIKNELFPIVNGFASGYVPLSDSILLEGNYQLRAYTDYLKNFGNDAFFTKTIRVSTVKNSLELALEKQTPEVELVTQSSPAQYSLQDSIHQLNLKSAGEQNKIDIQFFPEGGFLLADKINPLAFKATDRNGKDLDIEGNLMDETGKSVFSFRTVYKGMGMIYFIPKLNSKYSVEIKDHPELDLKLPEIRKEGAKLLVVNKDENRITLNVLTHEENPKNPFYLAVMHRGNGVYYLKIDGSQTSKTLRIKTNPLKNGINRIILLNHNFEPLSERLVFIDKDETIDLKVDLNKKEFKTREKVSFQISNLKTLQENRNAQLSVVVLNENAVNASGITQNIKSYLLLDSELKGFIDSPADYFVDDEKHYSETKLNLLMLVNGWKNYIWTNMKKEEPDEFKPMLGITLKGKIQSLNEKKVLADSELSLGFFTDANVVYSTKSDINGDFEFNNIQFYDSIDIFLQSKKNFRTHLELDSSYFDVPPVNFESLRSATNFPDLSLAMYRTKYFNENRLKEFLPDSTTKMIGQVDVKAKRIEPSDGHFRIYSEPTYELKVREIDEHYPSVIEYLSGRIPGLRVITNLTDEGGLKRSVVVRGGSPLFLLNGIPTDIDMIEMISMKDVDKVEVILGAGAAIFGMEGAGGAISILTKRGEGRQFDSGPVGIPGTIIKKIKGFSAYREFYSPKYTPQNIQSQMPDFRTILFWEPNLMLENGKAEVSFFSCDNIARYKIFVEGITENGKICMGSGEFEVNQLFNSMKSEGISSSETPTKIASAINQQLPLKDDESVETSAEIAVKNFITGIILNKTSEPVEFATVYNISQKTSCITNEKGEFNLKSEIGDSIRIQHLNYQTNNYVVNKSNDNYILLKKDLLIEEVVVSAQFAALLFDKSCKNTFNKFKDENITRAYSRYCRTEGDDTTQIIDLDLDIINKKKKNFRKGEQVSIYTIQERNEIDSLITYKDINFIIIDFYPEINWVKFSDEYTYTMTEDSDFLKLYFRPKIKFTPLLNITEVLIIKKDTCLSSVAIIDKNPHFFIAQNDIRLGGVYVNSGLLKDNFIIRSSYHYFKYAYTKDFAFLSESSCQFNLAPEKQPEKQIIVNQVYKTYNNGNSNFETRPNRRKLYKNKIDPSGIRNRYYEPFWKEHNYLDGIPKNLNYLLTLPKYVKSLIVE